MAGIVGARGLPLRGRRNGVRGGSGTRDGAADGDPCLARVTRVVNLTRIYTRTGDDGSTSLGDMSRTSKNDPRLVAYADVDEANSVIGVAVATAEIAADVRELLLRVQNELFDVGADLCTPVVADPAYPPLRVEPQYVDRLTLFDRNGVPIAWVLYSDGFESGDASGWS